MIPLAVPNLCGNEARYLQRCVETNFVSSAGEFVNEFERKVAAAAGTRHAVALSSGTCALHLALVAAGVKRDELVIVPAFTFIASANAISHAGAEPWLLDIDASAWTLDSTLLRQTLIADTERVNGELRHRQSGKRVAALMPVATLGNVFDYSAMQQIAAEFGLPLVVDAAAALGAEYNGSKIGALAELTCFSFNGNKTITCGGGGAVATNDDKLAALIKHISTTARVGQDYDHDMVGYNYRMTNIEAALGCAQLENLDNFLARKQQIAARYAAAFASHPLVLPLPCVQSRKNVYWFTGVYFHTDAYTTLPEVITRLNQRGIGARPFWKPLQLQKPYAHCLQSSLTQTNSIWNRVLVLPCSTSLTEQEQSSVIDTLTDILGARQ